MTSRRRVYRFTERAQALIDTATWPEGVKVTVEGANWSDQVFVYGPDRARAFWSLDPYDLGSADPYTVRATAIRRLESSGRDPRYTEESKAADLALAALLRERGVPDCPNGHGPMVERANPSPIAAEQGTWFDCRPGPVGEHCSSSVLYPPWPES